MKNRIVNNQSRTLKIMAFNEHRMIRISLRLILLAFFGILVSCQNESTLPDPVSEPCEEQPVSGCIRYLPVVVHVLHHGETIGSGANISTERIKRQIEILNEDFRRKKGTRGFNAHPNGGDAKIEFVLAKQDPNGEESAGIVRINMSSTDFPQLGYNTNHFSQYSYWDPNQYINIWTTPLHLDESLQCIVLGQATGPDTDLPGTHLLAIPGPGDAEGIIINTDHFGEVDIACHARFGRTLTHEMGHYLGLLHTWGGGDCEFNDYCDDTPAVDNPVFGSVAFTGCNGEEVMIGNYMNFSDDEVMNIFTNDQIARMNYVLENNPGRNSLLSSPGLSFP